jgi:hypothetical protein
VRHRFEHNGERSCVRRSGRALSLRLCWLRFGITGQTVYKRRKRDSVEDRSHTPHRLQTAPTPAQEAVAVVLRKSLPVSIDDLLAVVRAFLDPGGARVQGWTAACVATGSAICATCRRKTPGRSTRRSRPARPAPCTRTRTRTRTRTSSICLR